MNNPVVTDEILLDSKEYHTIKEVKNGQGPAPLKTGKGWLHIAHGVRNTAAGLRYVLYAFVTDLAQPDKIIASPGGFLLAPEGEERIGDVSNVLFCNGAVMNDNGDIYIYYASSDTRCHVGYTTAERMLDYCFNTPTDKLRSHDCVRDRIALIKKNMEYIENSK